MSAPSVSIPASTADEHLLVVDGLVCTEVFKADEDLIGTEVRKADEDIQPPSTPVKASAEVVCPNAPLKRKTPEPSEDDAVEPPTKRKLEFESTTIVVDFEEIVRQFKVCYEAIGAPGPDFEKVDHLYLNLYNQHKDFILLVSGVQGRSFTAMEAYALAFVAYDRVQRVLV